MNSKLKIKISQGAYDYFMELLNYHTEYDCIYITKNMKSCCKSSKADITLDTLDGKDCIDKIDNLQVAYDDNLYLDFSEVIIALTKTGIYVKTLPSSGKLL